MARDDQKKEYQLTPTGWVTGNCWINDKQTQTVAVPSDRVETWIEEICDSSEGWDPPTSFSKIFWQSSDISSQHAELNNKFPRPEYKPWIKPPRRSKKHRRTVFDY